jgi:hypothetical protein
LGRHTTAPGGVIIFPDVSVIEVHYEDFQYESILLQVVISLNVYYFAFYAMPYYNRLFTLLYAILFLKCPCTLLIASH